AALAVAPTLVVALHEAAHALDHAEVMVGVLPVGLRHDAVARSGRFPGQRLVLVEHLMGVTAHPHVRTARVENLVSIGRTIGIVLVMLLGVGPAAPAAATIATAARPLTIVWSHYLRPVTRRTGLLINRPLPFLGSVTAHVRGMMPDAPCAGEAPSKGQWKRSSKPHPCQPLIGSGDRTFDATEGLPRGLGGEPVSRKNPC